jgi:hypothetical protein
MTGLVPVIHDFPCRNKGVDGRDKPGHDEGEGASVFYLDAYAVKPGHDGGSGS